VLQEEDDDENGAAGSTEPQGGDRAGTSKAAMPHSTRGLYGSKHFSVFDIQSDEKKQKKKKKKAKQDEETKKGKRS
jgi:hypothetical protein